MILQIVTAISALICLTLTIYAFNMKFAPSTVIFTMFMLMITIFNSSNLLKMITRDNKINLIYQNVNQVVFLLSIPTFLTFIINFSEINYIRKPTNLILIYIFPIIKTILNLIFQYFQMIKEIKILKSGWGFITTPFALFIKHLEHIYILLSMVLLFIYSKKIKDNYQRKFYTMVIGILLLIIGFTIKILVPDSRVNTFITCISFTLAGILLFLCIFRKPLFSIFPTTRERLYDCISEGVLTANSKGIIIDKNNAADRFIEDAFDVIIDPLGKELKDLLKDWPRWYHACENMQQDEFEIYCKKQDVKKVYWVKVNPIFKGKSKRIGTVSVLTDITEMRHLEDMNSLKDKLFSVFTHDIRNPMATMVSLVELLEQDNECYSEECREIMAEVKKQVHYTYNIIENLLDWLNCQREGIVFSPAKWNLSKIIEEIISMYYVSAEIKGIFIGYKVDKELLVYTDREILELVLRNLLSNAIKFTNQGGSITVETFETDRDITIAVKDTGIGMDAEKVRNLFDEGYANSTLGTAGEKGIGLGLLICKEFIVKSGGEIWAESTPGKGSTFYISLSVRQ